MRIDFKQLAKIEKQYFNSNQNVSLDVLRTMLDQVIGRFDVGLEKDNTIAVESLKELGVLKDDSIKPVQQLNS
jgi:hypothetical protein